MTGSVLKCGTTKTCDRGSVGWQCFRKQLLNSSFLHKPDNGYMPVDKSLSPNRIGKETFWILRTNDFDATVNQLKRNGVRFRSRTYEMGSGGKEIVFEDLFGNLWVTPTSRDQKTVMS